MFDWGVIIAAVGLLATLIGFIIKLSISLGVSMEKLGNLHQLVIDNHNDAEKNFKELYDYKSESQQTLARMSETLNNINLIVTEIKFDLKERKN